MDRPGQLDFCPFKGGRGWSWINRQCQFKIIFLCFPVLHNTKDGFAFDVIEMKKVILRKESCANQKKKTVAYANTGISKDIWICI